MALSDFIKDLLGSSAKESGFNLIVDSEGIAFTIDQSQLQKIGAGSGTPLQIHQYVQLKMLAEEGFAEEIRNGFYIESALAVQLGQEARELLEIPDSFPGEYGIRISGLSDSESFNIRLVPRTPSGEEITHFELKGPTLRLSQDESFFLTAAEYTALTAVAQHQELPTNERDEVTNLRLVALLQRCKEEGLKVDLAWFEELQVIDIDRVKLIAKESENGGLLLLPDYGIDADYESVERRLWQLQPNSKIGSLRVENKRLVLDEKAVEATKEIVSRRKIAPDQVQTFLENPSAFIDSVLVDLDDGYSLRVLGATEFKPKFFGETDESGISWFEQSAPTLLPPNQLKKLIRNEEQLDEFRELFEEAMRVGSTQATFKEENVDVSNPHLVDRVIEELEEALTKPDDNKEVEEQNGAGEQEPLEKKSQLVLDIFDNDTEVEFGDAGYVEDVLSRDDIDWSAYKLTPYPYQEIGIRWLLGLSAHTYDLSTDDIGKYGALLADDMGLGKTFMALVAIREYLIQSELHHDKDRPVLVVAPLSLIENWEEEVRKVYKDGKSPFTDIIKLQANADLPKYRLGGNELQQHANADLDTIRHSLKIGKSYSLDRLDKPNRLVLTTYETLRDYQFSLCRVDWSIAVFDEAQAIKNPDTLAAIAARGLKARFKLIATGTPVENSLKDFWSLMDTSVPGYLGPWQEFRTTYIKPINDAAVEDKWNVRLAIGQELRTRVGPLMLRRVKESELEGLPTKTIFTGRETEAGDAKHLPVLRCPMTQAQVDSYELVIDLVQEAAQDDTSNSMVLAALHRLREVSLHPDLLEGGVLPVPTSFDEANSLIGKSGKLRQTFKLLKEIQDRDEKVIIFCINRRLQSFLATACLHYFGLKVEVVNGDTKAVATRKNVATRRSILKDFEAIDGFNIVVMSPIAAGTGLTVVGANNVIHLERQWNPAKEAQATDRVYRIGQTRSVNIYLPILVHPDENSVSFDENLDRLLQQKIALKDAIITPEEVAAEDMAKGLFSDELVKQGREKVIGIDDVDSLGWKNFEALAAELFARKLDGEATLTADGSDSGADGLVIGPKNALLQCKFTSTGKLGSVESVKEILYAKRIYEDAVRQHFDKLMVVTNAGHIDQRVTEAAKLNGVELVSRKELQKLLKSISVSQRDVTYRLMRKERLKV